MFNKPVFRGDRLRIVREDGVRVHQFTLLDFRKSRCEVPVRLRPRVPGTWTVYRLGTSQAPRSHSMKSRQGRPKSCPLSLSIRNVDGTLIVEGLLWGSLPYRASFSPRTEAAQRTLDEERIRDCFAKVDRSPFRVEAISVSLAEPMPLPLREMNRIRREFYDRLERFHDAESQERNRSRQDAIFREYEAIQEEWTGQGVPYIPEVIPYEELPGKGSSLEPSEGMWVELPLFVSEMALDGFLEGLADRLRDGRLRLIAHSLGWIDHLNQRVTKDRIGSGGYLYCSNRFAYKFLREQGATWVFLSADFREGEIRDLSRYRNTARARESGLRFFITRQSVPPGTYRFRDVSLQVIRRREYSEVVLASTPSRL